MYYLCFSVNCITITSIPPVILYYFLWLWGVLLLQLYCDGKTSMLWQVQCKERTLDPRRRCQGTCLCSQPWDWQLDLGSGESRFNHLHLLILFLRVLLIMCYKTCCFMLCLTVFGCWVYAGLNRCGKSCRLRWTNYLRPDLKHDAFTPQEENHILVLHQAVGSR